MTDTPTVSATFPRVAIVILNWNGWNDTVECLEALQWLDYPDFQTIVVDNGSTDNSVERIRAWARGDLPVASTLVPYDHSRKPVQCVEFPSAQAVVGGVGGQSEELEAVPTAQRLVLIETGANLGFAAGNNVGLRYALARGFGYVLLVNNDVVVEPHTLTTLVESLVEHPDWAGVAPKVLQRADPGCILYAGGALRLWQARAVHLGRSKRDGPHWSGARATGHVSACCSLFRTGFLADAGLLDEDFFFGQEDVALSCVARKRGWRLGVQLDTRVVHNEGHSLQGQPASPVYYYAKYRLLLVKKHASRLQLATAVAFLVLTRVPKFALALLRKRWQLVRAEIRGYLDFLAGRLAAHDRGGAAK